MIRKLEAFLAGVLVGTVLESAARYLTEQWAVTPPSWMGEQTCDYVYPHSGRCGLPLGHGGGHGL